MSLYEMFASCLTAGSVVDLGYEHGRHQGRLQLLRIYRDGSCHLRFEDATTMDIPALRAL